MGLRLLRNSGLLLIIMLVLQACTPAPPDNIHNVCSIFQQYPSWYWAAKKTQSKWGMPISTQMAIIYQESRFNGSAAPPRERILWVIPWRRPTSAYGYSQALQQTWQLYQEKTGNNGASRNDFADASDFIGWYGHLLHKKTGVRMWDTYNMYLAYHEGGGGYNRGTYKKKTWLIHVARKVQKRAYLYRKQLRYCAAKIKKPWWDIF